MWFKVGTTTVAMPATYYVGLAACSGDTRANTTETSTFDHVSLDRSTRGRSDAYFGNPHTFGPPRRRG